jgi:hypothetical protein
MIVSRILLPLALLALAGCTPGMNAAVQSVRELVRQGAATDAQKLDPKFTYLRVTRGAHVGLLWQGSTERNSQGVVEVYYGSGGEVLRLQNGRVTGASGLPTEWRRVEFVQAPAWGDLTGATEAVAYQRVRDVMPGYRAGVRDDLTVRPVEPPSRSALVGVEPHSVRWFEERSDGGSAFSRVAHLAGLSSAESLPPARYAVSMQASTPTVIYAEQCLSRALCFTWQRWSAALQARVQEARPQAQGE